MYQVLHVRYRYMWLKDMIPRVPVPQVGDTLGSMSLSHRYCWIRTCNTKSIFLEVHVLGTAWLNMYQEPGPQERRYSCNCMSRFVPWTWAVSIIFTFNLDGLFQLSSHTHGRKSPSNRKPVRKECLGNLIICNQTLFWTGFSFVTNKLDFTKARPWKGCLILNC